MAALSAATGGASVLLLEKDREIGIPVRCAEAVGEDGIKKILDASLPQYCIATTIKRFKFIAPDGTVVHPQVDMTGFVLHRKLFDLELARRAVNAGAQIMTGAYVYDLLQTDFSISGVRVRTEAGDRQLNSRIVIGADGVESRIARYAGLDSTVRMKDMETCCQVLAGQISVEADLCEFYFSQADFPGGYAWVFPKGDGLANVGLGIAGNKAHRKSVCQRLDEFMNRYFPGARILEKTVGGVPCAPRMKRLYSDGLLLCGDAAWQSNPVSGGGIITGMMAGKIAGSIAASAVRANDTSSSFLKQYEKEWDDAGGKAHRRYYRLKEGIRKLSDDQLNATARALHEIPQEQQTLAKIFQTALIRQPSLLVDIIKVISPFG
jgi:digeranylgeranylglycerophospholipid reductase